MALSTNVQNWLGNSGIAGNTSAINNLTQAANNSAFLSSLLEAAANKNLAFTVEPAGNGGGGKPEGISIGIDILSAPALEFGSYMAHELAHSLDTNGYINVGSPRRIYAKYTTNYTLRPCFKYFIWM